MPLVDAVGWMLGQEMHESAGSLGYGLPVVW